MSILIYLFFINICITHPHTLLVFYVLLFITLILITRLLVFNIFFLNTINSSETSNIFILTIFKDLLNSSAFLLRFFIQPIRLLLIFINGFLLTEFIASFEVHNYLFLNQGIILILRLLFEYIDFLAIFLIQFSAFHLMLLWLLKFMFSNNHTSLFEL